MATTSDGWEWLETTRELQIKAYGKDPAQLRGEERRQYWTDMHAALVDELSEFMGELYWKPWSDDSKKGEIKSKAAALGELIDLQHFVSNLALSIGATEEEFWAAYKEKQKRNLERQQRKGGYDNDAMKCPHCGRELDKQGAYEIQAIEEVVDTSGARGYILLCNACNTEFSRRYEALP